MESMETDDIGAPFSLMTNHRSVAKISRATWAGLFLSLFAMVVIRHAFVFFVPEITFAAAILKETLIWASAAALLVIIRRGEHLPLRSIGFGTGRWWMSILWGLVIAVVSGAIVGVLAYLTGYGHGPGSAAFEKLPLWLITLIVFRAGVVEELFYRGYAIERLEMAGSRTLLVGHNSAGYFFARPLVRRSGQYSDRACRGRNLDRILFVASRSGC